MYLDDEMLDDAVLHRLRAGMAAETGALQADPALASAVRHRLRHRRLGRVAVIAAPALATAGVLATVTLPRRSADPAAIAGPQSSSSSAVAVRPATPGGLESATASSEGPGRVALVLAKTELALANLDDYVVEYRISITGAATAGGGHLWLDPRTGRTLAYEYDTYGPSGPIGTPMARLLTTSHSDGTESGLSVDDEARTWTPIQGRVRRDPGNVLDRLGLVDDPRKITASLEAGQLTWVGTESRDGHDTLHLTAEIVFEGKRVRSEVWIDATTYLPVRRILHLPEYLKTTTLTWLPRTSPNLARFELTVPPGYRRV